MEGTPAEVNLKLLEQKLLEISNVTGADHLHVWTVTSGIVSMSCHLIITDMSEAKAVLARANELMTSDFKIAHTTIQVEDQELLSGEAQTKV